MAIAAPDLIQQGAPLSERLRKFRDARGLSRSALALDLGVTPITLYRWETGSTRPSPLAAERLRELGFGDIAKNETNLGSVPRLTAMAGNVSTNAAVLNGGGRSSFTSPTGKISFLAAPFVRNGPPDQASFLRNLLELQASSHRISREELLPRLSMVESVDDIGLTAQHTLERPRPIAVSWSSNYGTHGWHRYVGRFPPHVVRVLLNAFGATSKTVVLDPFAGSGTTAVECRLLGIPFIGIEICPLSSLITRTKAAFPENSKVISNLTPAFADFYDRKWASFLGKRKMASVTHAEILARRGNPVPIFANIERWFTPEALLGVSIAVEFGMSMKGFARDFSLLALSSKMRSIGNVDVDVVRAEYSKTPRTNVDVRQLVLRQLNRMAADVAASVSSHKGLIGKPSLFSLHEKSVLDVTLPEASVDCVITSPPYGVEAISYLRTHLLSYRSLAKYLKHDPYLTRDKTIGSEYVTDKVLTIDKRTGKLSATYREFFSGNGDSEDAKYQARRRAMMQFFGDMLTVGERMATWLKDDGQVAFILGNKRLGEKVIPSTSIVKELFAACGLTFVDEIRHKLKTNNSNSQVPWQERIIQEESILLFRRQPRRRP